MEHEDYDPHLTRSSRGTGCKARVKVSCLNDPSLGQSVYICSVPDATEAAGGAGASCEDVPSEHTERSYADKASDKCRAHNHALRRSPNIPEKYMRSFTKAVRFV